MKKLRHLTLGAYFFGTILLAMLMPPPINEAVALLWLSAAMFLPIEQVLIMVLSTSLLVPTLLNLAVLPGLALGLAIVGRMKKRTHLALFLSYSIVYGSLLVSSGALRTFGVDITSLILAQFPVNMLAGLVLMCLIPAYVSMRAQIVLVKAIESRISYSALH